MTTDQKLDLLADSVNNLSSTVTNLSSTVTNLSSTVTNLSSTVTRLSGRIDNIDNNIDNIEKNIDNIEKNMATKNELKQGLDNLEQKLESSLLAEIDLVQEKGNEQFDKINIRLENIENTVKTIKFETSTVNLLVTKAEDMQNEIDEIKQNIS